MNDDIEFLGNLREALVAASERTSISRRADGGRRPSRGRRSSALVGVCGLVAILAIAGIQFHHEGVTPSKSLSATFLGPTTSGPLPEGARTTLASAISQAPYPIYRPATKLALDSSISAVWVQDLPTDNGIRDYQVAIQYSSGIEVMLQPVSFDPATYYQQRAQSVGSESVLDVGGQPALAIPPGGQTGSPGSVAFVRNGIEVTIYGDYSVQNLMSVANTVV